MTNNFARRALLGVAATALIGFGAAAVAQPAWGPGGGYGMGWGGGYGPGMMGGGYGAGMMGWGGYGPGNGEAYGPGPNSGPGAAGEAPSGRGWNTGSYLGSLKSRLGITAAEEQAWDSYAKAYAGTVDQMQALREGMWNAMGDGSWEARRDFMNQAFQVRQQAFATMRGATDKLMRVLDPDQQQKARDILPGLGYGHGPGWMMGGGYGPGWMMGGYGPGWR